jgi:hypothetical protein
MARKRRAWILIPAVIIVLAIIGLLISNFQREAGLIKPGETGRAAVAAAVQAQQALVAASDSAGYADFSAALLVAAVAHRNMPVTNAAETRLDSLLGRIVDCLTAAREAWQAELNDAWDPSTHGRSTYWSALHPAFAAPTGRALTAADVRDLCAAQASELIDKAIDLAG